MCMKLHIIYDRVAMNRNWWASIKLGSLDEPDNLPSSLSDELGGCQSVLDLLVGMGGFPQATCVDTVLANTPVRRQEASGSGCCLSRQSSRGADLLTGDWAPLLRAANSVGRGWCHHSPDNTSSLKPWHWGISATWNGPAASPAQVQG